MALHGSFLIIDFLIIGVGLWLFFRIAKEGNKKWLFLIIVIFGIVCLGADIETNGQKDVHSKLSTEVNLQQVPVMGQKDFSAQIKLTYKNGKLESVILIPKTTEVLPATQEVEPKK